MRKMNIHIRNIDIYDDAVNEILNLLYKKDLTIIEAYGILEKTKKMIK